MKKLLPLLLLTSCSGYSSRDNTVIGQVKKVVHLTPLTCRDYSYVDLSLGVFRNGVGSVSKEDVEIAVSPEQALILQKASDNGSLVKLHYDVARWPVGHCNHDKIASSVEAL